MSLVRWQYRDTVLTLCMLAFFVTFFARLVISPVVPFIREDFQVSNTLIGVGLGGMWLAYGLSQYPSGLLGDRFGERVVILVAVGGTVLSSLLLAIAPVFGLFLLCLIGLGAVAGLHYTVGTTYLSRTWDNMGFAVGIHSLGAPVAGLLAPVASAWVGVRYGWQPAVALTVLVGVPVFIGFWVWTRPTPPRKPGRELRSVLVAGPFLSVVTRQRVAFTLAIAVLGTFIIQGLISFLPAFLVDHQGFSATLAGGFFAAYFVIRGVVQIGVGSLNDHVGSTVALAGCMAGGAIGIAVVTLANELLAIGLGIFFLGVGASFFPALDPRFLDQLSDDERGSEFGVVRTVYGVIGGAGSIGVGVAADLGGWAVAFWMLGGLYALAFLALLANWALDLGY